MTQRRVKQRVIRDDARARAAILLPALLALALVIALAAESARTVQMHRRAVSATLRDYAAFAAWQYTRRASDFLRLSIVSTLSYGATRGPAVLHARRLISAAVHGNHVSLTPDSSIDDDVRRAFSAALVESQRSTIRFGLVPVGAPGERRFLAYALPADSMGRVLSARGAVVSADDLVPIFNHVATFAPLLPPTVAGRLPNDSLITIRLFLPGGSTIAHIGHDTAGMSALDSLGPSLAGIRVAATLPPSTTARLIAGGLPTSNTGALFAMLLVTLVLCGVAVAQIQRTQAIVRMRADFVTSVSHELKTPLAQISLFADTLGAQRERPATERRQYASIISREARRLGQLVDGILYFAASNRDGSRVHREPSLLGEELGAAVAAFAPLAAARGVTVDLAVESEIELLLDRDAFRQLILNILDNAAKFGPDGQRIAIHAAITDAGVTITVDDQGPGIPPRERERVFDAFIHIDRAGARAGSGIGLAIARDATRAHGGEIRVTDSPTGGARIEIVLPGGHASASAVSAHG